jgi:mannose-1-phosphate guanylyltransferase
MNTYPNAWALVLAAGEGSRLRSLTTTSTGVAVPKQFCSLRGGPTLMDEALRRAHGVAPPAQVCAVVAEQHRPWWQPALATLAPGNAIVQPRNRGTAHGILLPLLQIMARDPDALVVLLPADHHVDDEATLAHSLRRAATLAMACPASVLLLGVEPEHADTELGYIVPTEAGATGLSRVRRFIEKPRLDVASALLDQGALWNVFIVVATARALLALYERDLAGAVGAMRALVTGKSTPAAYTELADLYDKLPNVDFSAAVLEGQEARLRVLPVPRCGWSDLGTPERVAQTLQRLPDAGPQLRSDTDHGPRINLAAQHSIMSAAQAASRRVGHAP